MDPQRFDEFARTFAVTSNRRSILRGLVRGTAAGLAAGAGFAGMSRRAAAAPRGMGDICRKDGDCASGLCGPKDRTGRRRCHCATAADCPEPGAGCLEATCVEGACQESCNNPYGVDACETAIHECSAAGQGTCPDGCFTMQATNGHCGCIASRTSGGHRACSSDADCVLSATCGESNSCFGDDTVSCASDADCAQFAVCIEGACGGQMCTTDADCDAVMGVPSICMDGPVRPCSGGGANLCWPLCSAG